jgi:transglutaminase-like putative cysteine protease
MKMTYDQMAEWIEVYFADFNKYGQDPREIHRMDEYFSKDFVFNPYIAYVGKVSGRDEWYKVLTSHPSGIEVLTPEAVIIDDRRQEFVAQIKTDLVDRDTREVLLTKRYLARYPLVEEDGKMKIERLEFFWEILPEGALEIDDVFERDWGKRGGPA